MTDRISPPAKSLILGRIRDALGSRGPAAEEYAAIARDYQRAPQRSPDERLALFVDRLTHYQVGVTSTTPSALPDAIAEVAARQGRRQLVIPADLPSEWLPSSLTVMPDMGLSYQDLDVSEGVLTGCTLAIAITGTIVLSHTRGEGRRALTLVPDYHLCVVFAEQIVETVPEAMRRIASLPPGLVTTISGPSATADIEMTRIRGVHGPRTLDVIVVN